MSGGSDGAPFRLAILTVSDACAAGSREDQSGEVIGRWAGDAGFAVVARSVVPDGTSTVVARLLEWTADDPPDLILTTGGTGLGPRDLTPEATRAVLDREAPGLAERLRMLGQEGTPFAAVSRGVAGIRGHTLIINLPGSPKAVREGLEALAVLLPHTLEVLRGADGGRHPADEAGTS